MGTGGSGRGGQPVMVRRRYKGKKEFETHFAKLLSFSRAGLAIDKVGPVTRENLRIDPAKMDTAVLLCLVKLVPFHLRKRKQL